MPEFSPGVVKAATLSFPVSPSGLSCTVELFLTKDGVTKVATSGPVSFVSTGAVRNVLLSITMPSVKDTYMAYIDVLSGGARIGAYQATDNVIIMVPFLPFTYTFTCTRGTCPSATAYGIAVMSGTIKNNNSVLVSQNVKVMWSRWSKTYGKWLSCAGQFVSVREYCLLASACILNPFPVSLSPGAQRSFNFKGYCNPDPTDPNWQSCDPALFANHNYYFWLEDDSGGKTNEVVLST